MPSDLDALGRAQESFERMAWGDAYAQLMSVDRQEALGSADLERLALAAYLTGRDEESDEIGARTHQESLREGDLARAARAAFWVGFGLIERGEVARGGGWLARAAGLLEDGQLDIVERGYLLLPVALQSMSEGDPAAAYRVFDEIARVAERFHDVDLLTLSRLGRGRALVSMAEPGRGVVLLDEAMVAVTAGEVSPMVVGIVYCAVIEACQDMFDLRRAQEWTTALNRWCESQPDLVPYRGQCQLYRAELMQLHGAWPEAIDEVGRAYERLSRPPGDAAAGAALYQRAELLRLRGDFTQAEAAYREAGELGRRPEPGLALLRLAQGRSAAAAATIRRALDEGQDRATRCRLLEPYVEICLATDDIDAARVAADELASIATDSRAPQLVAMATRADGAVRLAEGDPRGALAALRRSETAWGELDAPYELARVRVLIGRACGDLGDHDTAEMQLAAAIRVFQQLGAQPDVAALSTTAEASLDRRTASGLTRRELEVLRLVAAGKTNRVIAADLVISEKTVARHVANIFNKLDLSSRSGATAYAYEHGLIEPPT